MELWKKIPEFECYEVSNKGRVRSLARKSKRGNHWVTIKERILKPGVMKKCGHMYVNLHNNGKKSTFYVHRLVAICFIGSPETKEKTHVAHYDGDTSNNNAENLRWATPKENSQDSIRLGRSSRPSGVNAKSSKLGIDDLKEILKLLETDISIRKISKMFSVSHHRISDIKKGITYKKEIEGIKAGLM